MGGLARLERQQMDRFNRYWARLYEAFPQARAEAVKAMGQAAQQELERQIQGADLEAQAKGNVRTWQELRLGSKGGYAALHPRTGTAPTWVQRKRGGTVVRQNTYKGKAVTKRQVTRWLEKGHGVGYRTGQSPRDNKNARSYINDQTGQRFVAGRQFYSFTRLKAFELGRKAANKALCLIADEIDF